ncbi:unnamed protein product [Effrenium voratum]|nr:unnamed protein product [Effrenium voratum]
MDQVEPCRVHMRVHFDHTQRPSCRSDGETAPKVAQIARIQTIKTMRNSTDREQAFSQLRQRQMTDRFQNVTHGSKEMLTQVVALLTTAVHSPWFEWCMLLFVVASAIVVGVEVNKGAVNAESTSPDPGLMAVKHILTLIFVLEVAAKLLVDGLNFFRVDLGWNVLDMAIVVAGTIEFCWDMTVDSGEKGGEHGLLTAVRVGRALRLLRIHRLIHQVKALRMIYHSMLATMRSLFWAIALLSIIVYCFAVVFQQAVNDSNFLQQQELENLPHEKRLFTSISRTFGTLLQSCTGGLNWWEVEQALLEIHWFWVAVFLLYFSLIYFAMMNVVTAVFCSSAIERASMDQEAAIQEQLVKSSQYSETLRNVFSSMDSDKDGRVNIAEFEEKFDDPRCKALLGSLGIDEDKAWKLFEILDADCTGDISPEEFVSQGLRMRGSALRIDVERTYAAIKRQSLLIEDLNCQLDGLKEVINALQEKRGSGSTKSTHSEPRSSVET